MHASFTSDGTFLVRSYVLKIEEWNEDSCQCFYWCVIRWIGRALWEVQKWNVSFNKYSLAWGCVWRLLGTCVRADQLRRGHA
jgi:hypothetical protein